MSRTDWVSREPHKLDFRFSYHVLSNG
jgi:hypothetical protein